MKFVQHYHIDEFKKGSVRYHAVTGPENDQPFSIQEGAGLGMQYISKSLLKGSTPKRVKITVEWEE